MNNGPGRRIAHLGEAADRRPIGDPPGVPREPGCSAWVVLDVKAVEALGALHQLRSL